MLEDVKRSPIDWDKCSSIESALLESLQEQEMNLRELLITVGMLLIDTGASIEGVQETLDIESIWRMYATEPRLGHAMMAMGADIIHDWADIKTLVQSTGGIDARETP